MARVCRGQTTFKARLCNGFCDSGLFLGNMAFAMDLLPWTMAEFCSTAITLVVCDFHYRLYLWKLDTICRTYPV